MRAIPLCLAASVVSLPGWAQEAPPQILGGIVMLMAISNECAVEPRPERDEALAAAGRKLQAALSVPGEMLTQLAAEMADEIKGGDCTQARASFDAIAADLLAKAARVP